MPNIIAGCLGIVLLLVLLSLAIVVIKWIFMNIFGVIGIVAMVAGIGLMSQKTKKSISMTTFLFGSLLTLLWFSLKEPFNTLAVFFIVAFLAALIATIIFGIKRNRAWKQLSIASIVLLVLSVVFASNAPDLENEKSHPNKTEIASTETKEKSDDSKTTKEHNVSKEKRTPVSTPSLKSSSYDDTNKNLIPVTLIETVDGDTIKVNYKGKEETVRYLLVDTPESKKPGTCVQPYAKAAAERNRELVNSGNLYLEFDKGSERDKYGRLLAYVFVDGKSVQEELLKEGYARVAYIYDPPYKYLSTYENDEKAAQNKHLNIWSDPGYVTDKGFNGCAANQTASQHTSHSTHSTQSSHTSVGSSSSSNNNANTQPTAPSATTPSTGQTDFANCTELREVYPDGVPAGHPAYQPKLDRDHDNYACERN
ncbi:thermonuclease family protein [Bacillus sp. FSL W8-0223]|uniref:thermonuclease family protein n=1 Tax=Bacillus sp. FSL W8-0223 TaxID=2954595 RepID=UPI0030C8F1C8